jgi:Transposase DDE domain
MGFDSDRFRASIEEIGAQAVIPSSRSRAQAIPYDKSLYEERNLVERFINKIKHYRRIATRYEKTALSVCLYAIPGWRHHMAQVNVHRAHEKIEVWPENHNQLWHHDRVIAAIP